jgi:hypothetical protein
MEFQASEDKLQFKQSIKDACTTLLQQRIATAQAAMKRAQESANSEEKSSAGDKHETSRAMSQIDSEMNARQLAQAQRELDALNKLSITALYEKAVPGAVAISGDDVFFIGCGLGNTSAGDVKVIALSAQAPLAAELLHKKAGDQFLFKGKKVTIAQVF